MIIVSLLLQPAMIPSVSSQAAECKFTVETYRRGHNGTDSKSVYRYYTGTRVRIPPSPFIPIKILFHAIYYFYSDIFIQIFLFRKETVI